jgi:oligopeptide/dipeptide ABC transporter ATP-binding protein
MYAGRIVEQAACRPLFEGTRHPYTAGLLRSRPVLGSRGAGRRLEAIPGAVPDPRHLPPGCSFEPRCPRRKAVCAERMPPLEEQAPGHLARCWVPLS